MGRMYYDTVHHRHVTSGICGCPACRKKYGLLRKDEKEKLKKEKMLRRLDRRFGGLQDIPLFCRFFLKGLVGDCDFRLNGFCMKDEEGCVRWNELGDKKDYSVGGKNPFLR